MPEIVVIAHNIRSTHNVGSIFRTAEGFGVKKIILSGYTPYPAVKNDTRLPHITEKLSGQINKTALGAVDLVPYEYQEHPPLRHLRDSGYRLVALEQATNSVNLRDYQVPDRVALLLGEEVNGIALGLLAECDDTIEIPMLGQKESFNVSVAAGIALYALTTQKL